MLLQSRSLVEKESKLRFSASQCLIISKMVELAPRGQSVVGNCLETEIDEKDGMSQQVSTFVSSILSTASARVLAMEELEMDKCLQRKGEKVVEDSVSRQEVSAFISFIVSTAYAHVLKKIKQDSEISRLPDKPFEQRVNDGIEESVNRQEVSKFVSSIICTSTARVLAMSQEPENGKQAGKVFQAMRQTEVKNVVQKMKVNSVVSNQSTTSARVCSEPMARDSSQKSLPADEKEKHKRQHGKAGCFQVVLQVIH